MGVFSRYKKGQEGFRALVELWETTPIARREKMIEVGRAEDPAFTERALKYVMSFADILGMSDFELAEVVDAVPPRVTATAIRSLGEPEQMRFLRAGKPPVASEIREYLGVEAKLAEIGGAQLKMVEFARKLEREGKIRTKAIPGGA